MMPQHIWNDLARSWTNPEYLSLKRKKTPFSLPAEALEGWIANITLSPEQLAVVEQDEDQMMISGSAGTGKSLTMLYKLLKTSECEPERKRILFVSFNVTLIQDARKRLDASPKFQEVKDKHDIHINTFHYTAHRILNAIGQEVGSYVASHDEIRKKREVLFTHTTVFIDNFLSGPVHKGLPREQQLYKTHAGSFFMDEMLWMKANGFVTEEQYLGCERTGRGSYPRLTKEQRKTIFWLYDEYVREREIKYHGELDAEDYALLLLHHIGHIPHELKYDHIFIDEVQDMQPMQILSLVKLCKGTLTMSGDPKQRIYRRSPFSFKDLGINIDGRRNRRLRSNYRSTQQIMDLARSLKFIDTENDRDVQGVFVTQGRKPQIRYYSDDKRLVRFLVNEIHSILRTHRDSTIAVIHRYDDDMFTLIHSRVKQELSREFELITTAQYGRRFNFNTERKPIFFTDAFSVKGLEFDYVFILHFDQHHYPSKARINALMSMATDDPYSDSFIRDEDEIYNDEKKVLYVAITRAKKHVCLLYAAQRETGISQFVRDFDTRDYEAFGFKKTTYR
jgi:DNA helicase II / ATP-dependent DNA helicase PcrA